MAIVWKDRVKQAVSAGGTGAIMLGPAVSGYQALGAAEDGALVPYAIEDSTAWETGLGTYTHSGTSFARTARYASSTGAALNVSTAAVFNHTITAVGAASFEAAANGIIPGGRLSLASGNPEPQADIIGATGVWYTPHVSGVIPLWDGTRPRAVEFGPTGLSASLLSNSTFPHDVFGVLTSGQLGLEFASWANTTARTTANAVGIQGRYVRASDRALLLGTVMPSGAGTFEDSLKRRLVSNLYNAVARPMAVTEATTEWSYTTATWRAANNSSANRVDLVQTVPREVRAALRVSALIYSNVNALAMVGIGIDSTSTPSGIRSSGYHQYGNTNAIDYTPLAADYGGILAAGSHSLYWLEYGADNNCVFKSTTAGTQSGLNAETLA